jgi:glycosyltransferase involved in cell wall biosynthesis
MESAGSVRVLCISPAHPPHDPRVLKTIQTLSEVYDVRSLLPWSDVSSLAVLPFSTFLAVRLVRVHSVILWHIIRFRPQVLHLFMPELLPIALLARLWGCRIVYDVQENHRLKFDRKPRNKAPLFRWLFDVFDQLARRYAYCVFSEEGYLNTYHRLRLPFAVVHNFPDKAMTSYWGDRGRPCGHRSEGYSLEMSSPKRDDISDEINLAYLGLITLDRGLDTMISVIAQLKVHYPNVRLHLFGRCMVAQETLEQLPDYAQVKDNLLFYGHVDPQTAYPILAGCVAGFALLKPVGDYPESYPSKIFEYMALGLPVIASDFPLYRTVVEVNKCGFYVETTDVAQIARQVIWLQENPSGWQRIGQNGTEVVKKIYNWQIEAKKLLELYQNIDF